MARAMVQSTVIMNVEQVGVGSPANPAIRTNGKQEFLGLGPLLVMVTNKSVLTNTKIVL